MSPDYQADYWVRRVRLIGWGLILVMALAVVLALGWKIAEVSERRAMDATRAHLAASLSGLAAEQMAMAARAAATRGRRFVFMGRL